MKRILVLFSAVFAAAGLVSAASVSAEQAMAAADVWAAENAAFGAGVRAKAVITVYDDNQARTVLWHQVSMTGGGCLMMAPVTEIEPVVAALDSDPGELPANHPLRGILTADMRKRLKFLGSYEEDRPALSGRLGRAAPGAKTLRSDEELVVAGEWGASQNAKWNRLLGRSAGLPRALKVDSKKGVVDPISIEIGIVDGFEKGGRYTHWNQKQAAVGGLCYNFYTPEHTFCGCVATAMSAVMQYFACKGVCRQGEEGAEVITDASEAPTSDKCTFNGEKLGTLACIGHDAGEGESFAYDWSIFEGMSSLEDYLDASKMDEAHRELLGRVAYNAGVMVNMGWTSSSSGAFSLEVVNALRDAFGFQDARYVNHPSQEQYSKLIYQQCWAGKPVIMGIDGHEVVAVGYGKDGDGVDRVRVFLGWGGSGDAWYALPYISTASIPGGSTYLSETVDDVITMMSVDDTATYPVCGRIMPSISADVSCGGETVRSNGNGYFGLRVAAGTSAEISCEGRSTPVEVGEEVAPEEKKHSCMTSSGVSMRTCKYEYDAEKLCASIPGTFLLPLVNFDTAVTTPKAQELALASGKLIFAYSDPDSPAGLAVFNVIRRLSDENYCDCTNRYVFIALSYTEYSAYNFSPFSPTTQADYNGTSYGVFDPNVFVPANRWAWTNGRLEYCRVCEYDVVDGTNYVATAETEEAVKAVLAGGWEQYLRSNSTITLTVTSDAGEVGEVVPAWGEHVPTCVDGVYYGYTNGEEVVISAPEYVTNDVAGVVLKCVGWKLYENSGDDPAAEGAGNAGSFTVVDGGCYTNVWCWETNMVRVSANVRIGSDGNVKAMVTQVEHGGETKFAPEAGHVWCSVGDEVTFTVEAETVPVKYILDDTVWTVDPKSTEKTIAIDPADDAFGTITVTVADEPISITIDPHGSTKMKLVVTNSPAACAFGNPTPAYGTAYQFDNLHEASLASDTEVSGGVAWRCLGWELGGASSGSGDTSVANFDLKGTSTLTWKWGIDLTAMADGAWRDDPSTDSVTVLDKLPDGVDLSEVEFANVPEGWEATPRVDGQGNLVADLQLDVEEWVLAKTGVDLAIVNIAGEDELEVEHGIAVDKGEFTVTDLGVFTNKFTVTVPGVFTNEVTGLLYEPESWTAVNGSNVEIASDVGGEAVFFANDGDSVTLVWTWKPVGVRITALIDSYVEGSDYNGGEPGTERFSFEPDEVVEQVEEWCRFGETAEFTVYIDNSPAGYKFTLKDWVVEDSTAYEKEGLTIRVTAKEMDGEKDGPVTVTAKFERVASLTGLLNLTFDADPIECAYGSPIPAYGTSMEVPVTNNWMVAKMDVDVVDIEEGNITNTWLLAGWELRDGTGNVYKVYQSGVGSNANFRVTAKESKFVWKWELKPVAPERGEPVPPLGPGGASAMTFGDGTLDINVDNTVVGWWYGVYTKTDLANAEETWTYLKGFDPGNPATNLVFSIDINPSEKQRFFKIILTEDEPQSE